MLFVNILDMFAACVSHTVSSSRRTSNRTSLSGWYKMISLLESIDVIEIKNYGSANIVKGESRARRKSKILFKAMPKSWANENRTTLAWVMSSAASFG